jgi:hypothetical protein
MKKFAITLLLLSLAPYAGAQYNAVNNVLDATDPALSAAFREAQETMPAFTVPSPVSISGERYSDTPAEQYLPIHKQAVLEYEYTSSEFVAPKVIRLEYMSYSDADKSASVNMIIFNKSKPRVSNFVITAAGDGIRASDSPVYGPRIEIPVPLVYNYSWNEGPDRNRVAGLNSTISVPAGIYHGCLKITTRLSGGDAGSAVRYYAPGIGLIYEKIISEERQEVITLTSYQLK